MASLSVLVVCEDYLEEDITTVGAVNPLDKLTDVIRGLSERLDRLEINQRGRSRGQGVHTQQADMTTSQGTSFQYGRGRYSCVRDITCYACGMSGHIARYCRSYQQQPFYPPPQQPYQQPPSSQSQQPSHRQPQGNGRPPV